MNKLNYQGILLFGQNQDFAGRGIAGPRLRSSAKNAGFDIMIIDYVNDLSTIELYEILEHSITETTKFIGLSASWVDQGNLQLYHWYNQDFFDTIRKRWPAISIITGGHDEWRKDFLLKNSDYHFHGYSDISFVEFLKMINGQEHKLEMHRSVFGKGYYINSNALYPVEDPDTLETVFLEEDGFFNYEPLPIEIARGCIFRCGFCRHPFQGKKDYDSYQRTPESIARELKRNYELFGTTRYTILDDTFNDSIEKISRVKKAIELSGIPKFECVAYIKAELLVTKPEMIQLLADIGLRGAFIGFESFTDAARRSVGKGTKIEKVIDVCKQLASVNNGQVLIHGGFIVGLEGETEEEVINTFNFLISEQNTFIKSWNFEGLAVRKLDLENSALDTPSTFDKNFKDLGYSFRLNSDISWIREKDGWTYARAVELATKFNFESNKFLKSGGWRVAGCWQAGIDNESINFDKSLFSSLIKKLKIKSRERAYNGYKKITGK